MRKIVILAVTLLLVASACTSASDQPEATTSVPTAPAGSEAAWCDDFGNYPTIAREAIRIQVDGYESIEVEQARIVDRLGESFLDDFLGGFLVLEWKPTNEAAYATACSSAFASR